MNGTCRHLTSNAQARDEEDCKVHISSSAGPISHDFSMELSILTRGKILKKERQLKSQNRRYGKAPAPLVHKAGRR